jgi:hypothetical protein
MSDTARRPQAVDEPRAVERTERVSLRAELGAAPEPDFALTLPRGWGRTAVDEAAETMLAKQLRQRMMQAGRPDFEVAVRRMLRESFAALRENGAVAAFMPLDGTRDGLFVPASIIAVMRRGTPESPLDGYAQLAIRQHDAAPLMGDMRTMRFETESEREVEGEQIVISTTHYLTPVPGTRRRRALELMATYGRPQHLSREAEHPSALHALFDLCASSLRWLRPEGEH